MSSHEESRVVESIDCGRRWKSGQLRESALFTTNCGRLDAKWDSFFVDSESLPAGKAEIRTGHRSAVGPEGPFISFTWRWRPGSVAASFFLVPWIKMLIYVLRMSSVELCAGWSARSTDGQPMANSVCWTTSENKVGSHQNRMRGNWSSFLDSDRIDPFKLVAPDTKWQWSRLVTCTLHLSLSNFHLTTRRGHCTGIHISRTDSNFRKPQSGRCYITGSQIGRICMSINRLFANSFNLSRSSFMFYLKFYLPIEISSLTLVWVSDASVQGPKFLNSGNDFIVTYRVSHGFKLWQFERPVTLWIVFI